MAAAKPENRAALLDALLDMLDYSGFSEALDLKAVRSAGLVGMTDEQITVRFDAVHVYGDTTTVRLEALADAIDKAFAPTQHLFAVTPSIVREGAGGVYDKGLDKSAAGYAAASGALRLTAQNYRLAAMHLLIPGLQKIYPDYYLLLRMDGWADALHDEATRLDSNSTAVADLGIEIVQIAAPGGGAAQAAVKKTTTAVDDLARAGFNSADEVVAASRGAGLADDAVRAAQTKYSTTTDVQPRWDAAFGGSPPRRPRPHARLNEIDRERSAAQNHVMEPAQVEPLAEGGFGLLADA